MKRSPPEGRGRQSSCAVARASGNARASSFREKFSMNAIARKLCAPGTRPASGCGTGGAETASIRQAYAKPIACICLRRRSLVRGSGADRGCDRQVLSGFLVIGDRDPGERLKVLVPPPVLVSRDLDQKRHLLVVVESQKQTVVGAAAMLPRHFRPFCR